MAELRQLRVLNRHLNAAASPTSGADELASSPRERRAASVDSLGGHNQQRATPESQDGVRPVVLTLDDAASTVVRLHPLWLRERCGQMQESTGQRLFEVADCGVGALKQAPELLSDGSSVRVAFEDGAVGEFGVAALCHDLGLSTTGWTWASPLHVLSAREPWSLDTLPMETLRQFDVDGADSQSVMLGKIAQQMLVYGAAVIRNVPRDAGEVARFTKQLGVVRETEWGLVFDVKTEQNQGGVMTEDLAYTNSAIDMHFDNVYRDPVPGYWCLHCLESGNGGDTSGLSMISDGVYAAETLRAEDPAAFDVLTRVKVTFKYESPGETALITHVPHILLADDGVTIAKLTYSGRLDSVNGAAYSYETLDAYYKARARWLKIVRANVIQFKLAAGDLVILDNQRVMHGRTEITDSGDDQGNEAPRFMQGCCAFLSLSLSLSLGPATRRGFRCVGA